jgi:hypothetical protein
MNYVDADKLDELLDATHHVGDAPERTRRLAAQIGAEIGTMERV